MIDPSRVSSSTEIKENIPAPVEGKVLWIDGDEFTEAEVKELASKFNLDPYAVEDVLSGTQRPKVEVYDNCVFSIINVPSMENDRFGANSVFIFFSDLWVITLHRGDLEIAKQISERVRMRGLSSILKAQSPDIVYYMFFDYAVDHFYPVMDQIEDVLNGIESGVSLQMQDKYHTSFDTSEFSSTFLHLSSNLLGLRKEITPIRDILGQIMRGSIPFVQDIHLRGFRDIYDHTFQIIETVESLREKSFEIRDLHLNLITMSTNTIMKVLTIVVAVFTPLSLIAGIYGTNFTAGFFEPGSGVWYGFYVMIGSMIVIAALMILFFRRMKIL